MERERRLTFGVDTDTPMDKVERRRESWRRSSRKYRRVKARERAQETMFDEPKDPQVRRDLAGDDR